MKIAVINSGSSSLKVKIFEDEKEMDSFLVEHIGEGGYVANHHEALESLDIDFSSIDIVGHRVVHGGEHFSKATIITDEVIDEIQTLSSLAPLHNPANLEGIKVAMSKAPNLKQIAVFDTAFHSSMEKNSFLYAIDIELYKKHKIRRYGFHGISHQYLLKESAKILNKDIDKLNLITLHLGNGASICAIQNGKSIDTSMGFTPLEGLVMGTRSGDIDPSIVIYMQETLGYSLDEVKQSLNRKSGLFGISKKNDLRDILASNTEESKLAVDIMLRRIKKYIGSYIALLDDEVDGIILSGGIGENALYVQESIKNFKILKNKNIFVIKTDEELEIARSCLAYGS